MKQKNVALLEEISDINNFINSEQKRLENQLEKNSNSEIIKSIKLSIINSQKDLIEKQENLRVNKLDELKIILANKLADNSLNEPSYNNIIKDINNYLNAFKAFSEFKSTEFDMQIIQINEYGEDFRKRHETFFQLKKEDFNNQVENFIRNFLLYQISPDKQKSIISKSDFDKEDMENLFNELSNFIESEQLNTLILINAQTKSDINNLQSGNQSQLSVQTNTTFENSNDLLSIIKDLLPLSDIKNITCIDDNYIVEKLCELYNVEKIKDIQILAIRHFNNKTLGNLLDMPKEIYEQLHSTHYDTPIGEQIGLYCFNTITHNLVQMQNKLPVVCISKGENLIINYSNSQSIEEEIATIDFSGVNLSFYISHNSEMCIACNIDGTLQKVSTKTLEDIQSLPKNNQDKENSEMDKVQTEVQEKLDLQVNNTKEIDTDNHLDVQSISENKNTTLPVVIKKASLIKRFFNKLKAFFNYSTQTNGDV